MPTMGAAGMHRSAEFDPGVFSFQLLLIQYWTGHTAGNNNYLQFLLAVEEEELMQMLLTAQFSS